MDRNLDRWDLWIYLHENYFYKKKNNYK